MDYGVRRGQNDLTANHTIHEVLTRSIQKENEIGKGAEGVVYRIDDPDPFYEDFLLKYHRWNQLHNHVKLPWQNEERFRSKLDRTTALYPVADRFEGLHYGQALMAPPENNYSILLRQHGVTLKQLFSPEVTPNTGERYQRYLEWLLRKVPNEALVDLERKIAHAQHCGHVVDATKGNILWDEETQRFNLIDLHDNEQSLLECPAKTVQMTLRAVTGAARRGPVAATYGVLTYDGLVDRVMLQFKPREEIAIGVLENKLRDRLARILPERALDAPRETPTTRVQVEGIDNIRYATSAHLKDKLAEIRNSYGLR